MLKNNVVFWDILKEKVRILKSYSRLWLSEKMFRFQCKYDKKTTRIVTEDISNELEEAKGIMNLRKGEYAFE